MFWGAIFGVSFNSWILFGVTTGILIAMGVVGGGLRFSPVPRHRNMRRRFAIRS